jgi:hypothetical protein
MGRRFASPLSTSGSAWGLGRHACKLWPAPSVRSEGDTMDHDADKPDERPVSPATEGDVKPLDVDLGEFMNDAEEDADAATMLRGNADFDLEAEATAFESDDGEMGWGVLIEDGINLAGDDVKPWDVDLVEFMKDVEEEIHDSAKLNLHEGDTSAGVQKEFFDSAADFAPGSEPQGDTGFFDKSQPLSDDAFFGDLGELWVGSENCCDGPGSPMDVFGEGRVSPILGWVSVVIVTIVAGVSFATLWPRIFIFFR